MNWQTGASVPVEDSSGSAERSADVPLVSISEVCAATGLSPRTLRYYEELGLLPGVRRREGGRRAYGPDELERLAFIQRLKALGLSLAEVKELNAIYAIGESTGAMLGRLEELLGRHLEELDARIDELDRLRREMGRYREHVARRVAHLNESAAAGGAGEEDPS
ncbi:MAG: MerR family transcriptional regulator [Myxococcota bacterium]